jgi:thiamine kinase-like enzyme
LRAVAGITQIVAQLEQRLGPLNGDPVPLEGGITNRNYRARFGATDYVVRLPGRETELLGISREAERLAGRAAAELGIGPQVALADSDCLVTRFLGARPAEVGTALPDLARALRCFHDCGISLPVRFWVPELLDRYAELVRDRGGELPREYAQAQALARRIESALPLTDPVPCHNDLLPGNLLYVDLRVVLVDWEYAGMGHRLFDLGNLAVNNDLDADGEARLLDAYCGGPAGPGRVAALRLMRLMSDAREAAWGVLQSVISELDFDFAAYARRHFARLERAAGDGRLEEWLSDAAAA